ncbi:hypothetical protein N658DRAFT_46258 [Parathielavia hyrcaniae]|uniref:SRR1-like domain-containing protein n=1 Tax=Parathielavia hyrcaniae TaxID=113614 RepID=A0AAN6SWT3_9PEZI|nr:hypothetical protein N658DRAFT_46258 [Parathielavia hyrcaniae]
MPYYPLPIPAHVMEEVENEERHEWKDEERRAKIRAEIRALWAPINAIYDSGTPFFTKAAIGSLVQQIDEAGIHRAQTEPRSLKLSIVGIDGKTVDTSLQIGVEHPLPPHWPRREDGSVLMDAMLDIDFRPIDRLTSIASAYLSEFDLGKAFLTMTVSVLPVPVRPATGEVVPDPADDPVRPASETRAVLQQEKEKWDASAACRELMATLQAVADAGRLPRVDNVVAFACHRPSVVARAERVATEHALVLSIRDFFARRHSDPTTTTMVWCYAQDPLYEDVDREVLGELGMTVLDHPRGFLQVDESTAVFALAPGVAVRQVVADIARPALMIWDKVCEIPRIGTTWVGRAEQADNISPRVEVMIKDYAELPFSSELAGFGSLLAVCFWTSCLIILLLSCLFSLVFETFPIGALAGVV